MSRSLRISAWYLALVAILLRAVLPAGWMPVADADGGPSIIICTGHGALVAPIHRQKQTPLSGRNNEICPFAAAAHLSPPASFALLPTPVSTARKPDAVAYAKAVFPAQPRSNHAPRAPPAFA